MISEEELKTLDNKYTNYHGHDGIKELITSHRELSRALEVAKEELMSVDGHKRYMMRCTINRIDDAIEQINQITKGSGE